MQNLDLRAMAEKTGTPAYVFCEDLFRERAALVKEAFGEKVGLCFSIKANPFLLKILPEQFSKVEVCSPGELCICERLHIDMQKVVFSGVHKSYGDVERALEDGAGVLTAESFRHMEVINTCAMKKGVTADVLVRVTGGSQFGMDAEDVIEMIRNRKHYPGIRMTGIHYFTGTQKRKPAAVLKELDFVGQFLERVELETGYRLECVEYGTGLAVDYFREDADCMEAERLAAIASAIRDLGEKVRLTVEMGRFFAAPCGFYLTGIADAKTNQGIHYAICDGGLHQLKYDGQIQGMQIPMITHIRQAGHGPEGISEPWTICGSLCTTADVLARNAMFDSLDMGDILVFGRAGAYSVTEGMSVFLSRDMPKVWLLTKDGRLKLVRDRVDTDILNTPVWMEPEA